MLRFKKMDYTEHADAGKLKMERLWIIFRTGIESGKNSSRNFRYWMSRYMSFGSIGKNESPIKENDVQEPLTVNGAVQKNKE